MAECKELTKGYITMSHKVMLMLLAICLFAFTQEAKSQSTDSSTQTPSVKNPSPELVDQLTKQLSITPEQAIGGSGAIFGLAKTKLKPEEFSKVSDAVPGMDGLLKAAPKP